MGPIAAQAAVAPDACCARTELPGFAPSHSAAGRGRRLAAALASPRPGRVALLCCDSHRADFEIGYLGVVWSGATPVIVPPSAWSPTVLRSVAGELRLGVALACAEGAAAWRRSHARGHLIADAPDAVWWRGVELRAPRDTAVAAVFRRRDLWVEPDPDVGWRVRIEHPVAVGGLPAGMASAG